MALLDPTTWDLDFFLLRAPNDVASNRKRRERVALAGIYLAVYALARFWLGQVMKYVPEPYLDEIFHIPQAQAYCRGELGVWDPKLTTPPGLYVISTILIKAFKLGSCTVQDLRTVDCFALVALLFAAQGCRSLITGSLKEKATAKDRSISGIDWDAVHTGVNIALFPPLFFFSGLYYTDVLSTCIVVAGYYHFLESEQWDSSSLIKGVATYAIGVVALFMRQTNIFWVAVFMAGFEAVRTLKGEHFLLVKKNEKPLQPVEDFVMSCYTGAFHDPELIQSGVLDLFFSAVSLALAVTFNLRVLIVRIWPYIALLLSFGGFVYWNGGVVLGDKSNHVATIHLPQMLYLWPFMAFFSMPLLSHTIIDLILSLLPASIKQSLNFSRPTARVQLATFGWLLGSILVSVLIIYFNTIIHPFTLADNRHYVFYVFRYTIRRHPLVKYALAPAYVLCGWLVLRCLAGASVIHSTDARSSKPVNVGQAPRIAISTMPRPSSGLVRPRASFALIWLISTALSLITAPLVEPRYFIIPWVVWRLHVPELSVSRESSRQIRTPARGTRQASTTSWAGWAKYWAYKGHDYRLWVETAWFLLISVVTSTVFLFRGFEWPQEPGLIQRFMW